MNGGGMPEMPGMGGGSNGTASPGGGAAAPAAGGGGGHNHTVDMSTKGLTMHMTFFWGKDVEVLFSGFPGARSGVGLYVVCLLLILSMAFAAEALSAASRRLGRGRPGVGSGIVQTAVHATRVGLAYLVMLGTMSFNGGVLIAAVAGHALGFFLFGSTAFKWGRAEYNQIAGAAEHPMGGDKS